MRAGKIWFNWLKDKLIKQIRQIPAKTQKLPFGVINILKIPNDFIRFLFLYVALYLRLSRPGLQYNKGNRLYSHPNQLKVKRCTDYQQNYGP